jgi:MraZ protein
VFFGQFEHSIDAKGRVSIPAPFRDAMLGQRAIVLARNTVRRQRCLEAYPDAEWQQLLREFAKVPRFSEDAERFEMGYLARSHPCEIDAAGRILVPPTLRQYAELKKDVVFLGANLRFRLMDRDKWLQVEGELDSEAAVKPALFGTLGI